ncbi:MAG: hypothetical protein U0136_12080 [Bdellovibrionota bacterium]
MFRNGWRLQVVAFLALGIVVRPAFADEQKRDSRPALKNPFMNMFPSNFAANVFHGKVEQLPNDEAQPAKTGKAGSEFDAKSPSSDSESDVHAVNVASNGAVMRQEQQNVVGDSVASAKTQDPSDAIQSKHGVGPLFVGDVKPEDILTPDLVPQVRINKEAPSTFIGLDLAVKNGDRKLAAKYADAFVRYQANLFFEVREITQLIGEALIRQRRIDEDDWQGVPQYLDYEFAQARAEKNDVFRPTNDDAMARIKSDPKNQASVYYFFNATNCRYCREMTPDFERLYQVLRSDPRVKIAALDLGQTPKAWMQEYRNYTGLTAPVFDGAASAKAFGVGFLPALVVVPPNGERAYLKTGRQSFERMYQFVRKVQGVPADMSLPEVQAIMDRKFGEIENANFNPGKNLSVWLSNDEMHRVTAPERKSKPVVNAQSAPVSAKKQDKLKLERF